VWAYVVVILLILLVGVVQARRPLMRGAVEMVGAYIGLWIANALTESAVAYVIVFVVWYGAMVGASYAAERASAFSLESWDSVLGGVCGIVTAIIFAHMIFRAVMMAAGPESQIVESLEHIWISREVLYAASTKHLFGLGQEFATEVGR